MLTQREISCGAGYLLYSVPRLEGGGLGFETKWMPHIPRWGGDGAFGGEEAGSVSEGVSDITSDDKL